MLQIAIVVAAYSTILVGIPAALAYMTYQDIRAIVKARHSVTDEAS